MPTEAARCLNPSSKFAVARDDGDAALSAGLFPTPDLGGGLKPVHDRHLEVHEDHVVVSAPKALTAICPFSAVSAVAPS